MTAFGPRKSNFLLCCFLGTICAFLHYRMILFGILTSVLYECYRFVCEIYIKKRWIQTRDGCPELEDMYGKILDDQIYLHPGLWKIEKLELISRFILSTSRLTIYQFIIAILAIINFSTDCSSFELIQYIISMQMIEIIKSELNKWHSAVINQFVAKMQQRYCNHSPASSDLVTINSNQDAIYSILNAQTKLSININELFKEQKETFVKLDNECNKLLDAFKDSNHGPKLDSSLTAIHNALARLVQEIISLRTDGIAEARKEIHALNLIMKAFINSKGK